MLRHCITIALGLGLLLGAGSSCTKYNLIETGLANGKHNKPMSEYFNGDPYNWSLTTELIQHAGLGSLFTQTGGEGITFLGITNHSIRRYILQKQDQENEIAEEEGRPAKTISIADIPRDEAREMLERCILRGRHKLADIPEGRFTPGEENLRGSGGKEYETLAGTKLWIYTFREAYDRIPGAGAVSIYVVSEEKSKRVKIASSDIETLTGVVHSLPYQEYTLGEL